VAEYRAQSVVEAIERNVVAVYQLIEKPKYTMHVDLFSDGKLAQVAVPGEQGPTARLRNSEGKGVGDRQTRVSPPQRGCVAELGGGQDFNAQP